MPPIHHILIVDDHAQVRNSLARLIAQLYPHVTIAEAANGAEALSAIGQRHPDLIISDNQMPVMGGLELIRTLRAQGATTPILLLSLDLSIAEAVLATGATAFLPKPVPVPALKEVLRTLLPDDTKTRARGE